ncbi:hypothetical protein D3C86_1947190 [compost metagenome]
MLLPINVGSREIPSVLFTRAPVIAAKVAIISNCTDTKSLLVFAGIFPGQRAMKGSRMPPSNRSIFKPLKPATLLKYFA